MKVSVHTTSLIYFIEILPLGIDRYFSYKTGHLHLKKMTCLDLIKMTLFLNRTCHHIYKHRISNWS